MNATSSMSPEDTWMQLLDQNDGICIDWTRPPLQKVLSLFRVIHQRPDLAVRIHHVSMLSSRLKYPAESIELEWEPPAIDGNWGSGGSGDLSSLYRDDVEVAKDIIGRAQFPSPERWTGSIEAGDPYAFAAVIISQLHNLRSLQLDYTFVWQGGFPGLMMRHALTAPSETPLLSRFLDLSLVEYGLNVPGSRLLNDSIWDYVDGFPICDPEQFAGWFHLPSLVSLEIWLQSCQGLIEELPQLVHLAQLERLVLTASAIDEAEVRSILSHLSSLRILDLGLVYPSFDKERDFNVVSSRPPLGNPGVLLDGLKSIENTVEHLSISLELCPLFWVTYRNKDLHGVPEKAFSPFLGFLKHFPHLRTAELPTALLFGWTSPDNAPNMAYLLPPTLKKLSLRNDLSLADGYEWEMDSTVQAIIKFLPNASMTPLLKTITMRSFEMEESDDFGQSIPIPARSVCRQMGLDLDITLINDSLTPGLWTTHRVLDEYVKKTDGRR